MLWPTATQLESLWNLQALLEPFQNGKEDAYKLRIDSLSRPGASGFIFIFHSLATML